MTFPLIFGIVEYFVKRSFLTKDFQTQQKIQHSNWLLQQIDARVKDYYAPLTKFALESRKYMEIAIYSKEEHNTIIAFYYLGLFLNKYVDFELTSGSNFIFIEQTAEKEIIGLMRSLLRSLPFDRNDINNLAK